MSKIACFGGSFNPPHLGHLHIALTFLRQEHFDEVWFIPTVSTPLKEQALVYYEDRVEMIERLIKPYRKLKICKIESTLSQPNYTINTVKALQEGYPEHRFTWVIGSDQANQFSKWKDADELLKLIPFRVVVRDPADAIRSDMRIITIKGIDRFSSTNIRHGKLGDTPQAVLEYIFDHELYLESIAKSFVSDKRWIHVKQVEKLALELGTVHHLDLHQIRLAALFHDCTKLWKKESHEAWLSFVNPSYLDAPSPIWHQKTGAAFIKRVLGIKDKVIISAIANHVTGQKGHPITQVIFIADKCEPSRDYDVSEELALAKIDLDKAAALVSRKQTDYLEKETNASEHPTHR